MRYSSYSLRRSTAEDVFRVCHRRGWEPALRRTLGLWNVSVAVEPVQPVVMGEPQSGQRYGRLAAISRRIA